MKVSHGGETLPISLSSVFEPLQDILKWVENISSDCFPSELIIDEEGHGRKFIAKKMGDSQIDLRIYDWMTKNDGEIVMKIEITTYELVKSFLNRLQSFVTKNKENKDLADEFRISELSFEYARTKLEQIKNRGH